MRGCDHQSGSLFSYVDLETRIRPDHPLRTIRRLVDDALASLDRAFTDLYAALGRPSIPPECLLRAMLLQAFFSVRSERQLMERLDYDLLFRWFVGLSMDDAVWDASTFSKNRDRLLEGDVARVPAAFRRSARVRGAVVERSLLGGWDADQGLGFDEGFRPKDGSGEPPAGDATASATSGARSARTKPMPTTIPTRSSIARATVRRASCASWGT